MGPTSGSRNLVVIRITTKTDVDISFQLFLFLWLIFFFFVRMLLESRKKSDHY